MFEYGSRETDYLAGRDARLGDAIARIGHIEREINPDVFASLTLQIVRQQISRAAFATVSARLTDRAGGITPASILALGESGVQACGMSHRKAASILSIAGKFASGALSPDMLCALSDDALIRTLSSLPGVGVWTAEMLLIFCFARPDVLSFGDFGIRKGICMLQGQEALTKAEFEVFRARCSPYGTVASFYLWEIAAGKLSEEKA